MLILEKNERIEVALKWCKKHRLRSEQLNLFDRQYKKKLAKGELDKKEFEEMCKKAGIKKESLCKTIFTENL